MHEDGSVESAVAKNFVTIDITPQAWGMGGAGGVGGSAQSVT